MQDGLVGYPLRGPGGVETVLLGGGLHLLAAFLPIVPYVPVVGYLLAVALHTARDHDAGRHGAPALVTLPPTRGQLRRLFADGLRGTLVTVGYLAVPTTIVAVTLRGVGQLGAATDAAGGAGLSVGGLSAGGTAAVLVGGTAALVSAAVFCYPIPAVLTAVARRRRLRAAVDRDLLRAVATDARYFVGWTTGVATVALGAAVAAELRAVAAGFFVLFYVEVVAAAAWGWGCSRLVADPGTDPRGE